MSVNLGTNLNWCVDWDPEKILADLIQQGRPWAVNSYNGGTDHPADWVGTAAGTSLDSQGWPIVPVGTSFGMALEYNVWPGVYKLSFTNRQGSVGDTVYNYGDSNYALSNRIHNTNTGVTTYDVTCTSFVYGSVLWLRWAGSSGGIYDVHLMRPLKDGSGHHAVGTILSDHIIDRLAHFSTIRTMLSTSGASGRAGGLDVNWSDRTKPWSSQQRSGVAGRGGGVAWENVIAAANQAQKDVWVNVPFYATNDYILQMARCFAFGSDGTTPYTSQQASPAFAPLDANLNLYVEHANEIWNGWPFWSNENYSLNNSEIAAGDPNRTTYTTGSTWEYSYRRTGWLAVRNSLIFRGVFGPDAMMTRVRPVLATQHAGHNTTTQPINYIRDVWGTSNAYNSGSSFNNINGVPNPRQPVSYYLYALATAPYVPDGNTDITVTNAAAMLSSTYTNLISGATSALLPSITWAHDIIATPNGIQYIAYEGGNNLIPELMGAYITEQQARDVHLAANDAAGAAVHQTEMGRIVAVAKDANYDPTLGAAMGAGITGGVPNANQVGFIYGTLFNEWTARGGGLFCHYTLGYGAGAAGTWGLCPPSTTSSSDPRLETGPKWDAIKAFTATDSGTTPVPPTQQQSQAPLGHGTAIGTNRHWRL